MSKNIDVVILSAGRGTRVKTTLPKVLLEVCGRPMAHYIIEEVLTLKELVDKIIVVVGYKKELVRKSIEEEFDNIHFCVQEKLNGTGKAVEVTLKNIKRDNVLVLCGDTPLITHNTLRNFISFFYKSNCHGALITTIYSQNHQLGRIKRDIQGRVEKIIEKEDVYKEGDYKEINSGIYLFKKGVLEELLPKIKKHPIKKEYFLTEIVELAYKRNYTILPYLIDSRELLSVNNLQDLYLVREEMRRRIINRFIEEGVDILDPATTFISYNCKIGKDTKIYPFTIIEKNVIIGKHCKIGPFTHLREGTVIKDKVEVGNFAEIVRSTLNESVKMKHFSYLGDAQIEKNVNIGAGTVTANYDGKKKNRTIIKEGAFIGSDTILVAPVVVGKKSITGAGCVVKKNVEDKEVVVGVPARVLVRRKDVRR